VFRQIQIRLFAAIASLIAHLPTSWYPSISRGLMILAWPWMAKERKKLQRNVEQIYQLPPHSSFAQSFSKQVFQHQAVTFLETISSVFNPNCQLEIKNFTALQQTMQQALAAQRGLIVVTGHMGSWELAAQLVAEASQQPFHALAKPSKLPAFTEFLESLRTRMKTKVLWTDRKSILKDMMQVLKDGACLGFVMDQKPEGRVGPAVDFFGLKTEFVSGPAKLALRFKTPVIAVFCMREGPMSYRLCVEAVLDGNEVALDELAATQKMATAIEKVIHQYPEQWVWNYKRWRFAT